MATGVLLPALFTYLRNDSVLPSLVQGIFDEVPENEPFPFLVISDTTEIPDDGYNQTRRNITVTLHVWSESTGMQEIETIHQRLALLLHHQSVPNITGYVSVMCEKEFETVLREPDGITRHGVQRYRFLLEKIPPGF